ncbi:MAG: ADP-ribosylglycohydrolase family protein [Bacteroidota bacterium]
MRLSDKIRGSLFGMAIGDGFGYPTEFLKVPEILAKWPPNGPQAPAGTPILVTDDTQMAIAVGKAVMASSSSAYSPTSLQESLISHFIIWLNDPENNRAPGMTCLDAIENLEEGQDWQEATIKNSKGCGANMRVIPVGLLTAKGVPISQIGAIAQFQSAITHAHPTALTASEITAIAIAQLINGLPAEELLSFLLEYTSQQKDVYHATYLKDIWDRPPFYTKVDFTTYGWGETEAILQKVQKALEAPDADTDPCILIGEGWIAEETFATALYCFLLFPNDPVKVLRRAVVTAGDSDSIACLAGGLAGAHCGIDSFPSDWVNRIEYKSELEEIAQFYAEE